MAEPSTPSHSMRTSARLLDDLTVAAVGLDLAGRVSYLNKAAVALFGVDPGALVGQVALDTLFAGADRGAVEEISGLVHDGSRWSGELNLVCSGRHPRELATSWSPTYDGDRVDGVVLLVEDTQHATVLTRQLDRLGAVSADLLESRTVDDVAAVITGPLTDAAGATVSSFALLVDDETVALVAIRGGTAGVASRWATFPLASDTPGTEAIRTRRPVVLEGRAEIAERYPNLERAAEGERSIVCLPLAVGGRDLGMVSLSFPGRQRVDAAELLFLELLSQMCAHAIDRIRAQEAAADREAKLAFLAEASVHLASDLDYEGTLTAVAEAAVPTFADWCAIALEDDGRLRTIAVAHAQPEQAYLVEELQTKYPADPDAGGGSYRVLRTGESELVPEVSDDLLTAAAQDEEHLRLLRLLNFRSGLICPLKVHDRVLGVITWVAGEEGRRFGPADLAFGEELARRASVAIDNAQLHTELRDVALRLQHAVLPERLPDLPGWQTAVVYRPAGRTDAGGDFYDVVDLGDGRVAVFVGDVMGRGVQAASVMAQMRSAVRTLIALDPDPAAVMAGLDQVFDRLDLEHLVTIAYGVADATTGTLSLISAGHPPPLLLHHDGDIEVVSHAATMLLGAGGGERSVVTRPFGPGDTALLFTDGLVERRGEDVDVGTDRLVQACRTTERGRLADFVARIVDDVRDPTRDDDVAALAIRRMRS